MKIKYWSVLLRVREESYSDQKHQKPKYGQLVVQGQAPLTLCCWDVREDARFRFSTNNEQLCHWWILMFKSLTFVSGQIIFFRNKQKKKNSHISFHSHQIYLPKSLILLQTLAGNKNEENEWWSCCLIHMKLYIFKYACPHQQWQTSSFRFCYSEASKDSR